MALSHPEDAFLVVVRDLKRSRRLNVLEKARYKMNFSIFMKLRKELEVFNVSSFTKPFFYCKIFFNIKMTDKTDTRSCLCLSIRHQMTSLINHLLYFSSLSNSSAEVARILNSSYT